LQIEYSILYTEVNAIKEKQLNRKEKDKTFSERLWNLFIGIFVGLFVSIISALVLYLTIGKMM